jgi:radical SAM superfamily enzyme YgiQ (UPF0313 family)
MTSPPTVVLVNPPITEAQRRGPIGPVIQSLYFNSPPLGLAYLAAVLEREAVPVRLLDAAVEGLRPEETVARIRGWNPDIVGLTSTTNFFCNALDLAQRLKAAMPGAVILIGGPHVTSNPQPVLDHACFDVGVKGEGELTLVELVRALAAGGRLEDIPGLVFRRDGRVVETADRPLIQDLDTLPMPARHLLPLARYIPQPNDGPYLPKFAMITSRGCPYQCIFCDHGVFGTAYRSFSARRIVDEMEQLVSRYGAADIAFVDSLFMPTVKRVDGIVEEILRRGLKVHWTCTIRANVATRDMLMRMKQAGCWRVRIGVEAGDPEVLRFIQKHITRDQVARVVKDAHDAGLHPKAFFMIGHPTETEAAIRESIAFAKSLPLTDITVQINTPLPGAPQSAFIREHGELVTTDFERYSFWEPVFVPAGLTRERMDQLYRAFYRSFYFRPIIVWRHLKMLRSWSDVARYWRALSLIVRMFIRRRTRREA